MTTVWMLFRGIRSKASIAPVNEYGLRKRVDRGVVLANQSETVRGWLYLYRSLPAA